MFQHLRIPETSVHAVVLVDDRSFFVGGVNFLGHFEFPSTRMIASSYPNYSVEDICLSKDKKKVFLATTKGFRSVLLSQLSQSDEYLTNESVFRVKRLDRISRVLFTYSDGEMALFDPDQKKVKKLHASHTDSIWAISTDPNESHMMTTGWDCKLIRWDLEDFTAEKSTRMHTQGVSLKVSSDFEVVLVGMLDKSICEYRIKDFMLNRILNHLHLDRFRSINTSSYGLLITASDDGTVKFPFTSLPEITVSVSPIMGAAMASDAHMICACDKDGIHIVRLPEKSKVEELVSKKELARFV